MPGEKTEKASLKKRQDERKKGNIFQSRDLVNAAVLFAVFTALNNLGSMVMISLFDGTTQIYTHLNDTYTSPKDLSKVFSVVQNTLTSVLTPIFFVSITAAVVITFAQTRMLITPSILMPKLERLSIIQGFKKLFSLKSVVEMVKSIIKIIMIISIIFFTLQPKLPEAIRLFDQSLPHAITWIADSIIDVGFKVCAALFALGIADFFYQWWEYERNIMMTKHEVKEEFKQTEGNPEIKSRIRTLRQRMARLRMMQAVPKADVVIRNPEHYAVALKYDEKNSAAPIIVAKGQDAIALKIIEIADKSKVYITENKPLAQALYKTVDIGNQIPADFYKAVAEILAHIYRLKQSGRR